MSGQAAREVTGFLRALTELRMDRARGPVKPYKPLLVAGVLVLIAKGKIGGPRIFLDGALQSVFHQLLRRLYPSWEYRADVRYPFRHLETDGVWRLEAADAVQLDVARACGARARELMRHVACAVLDEAVFEALRNDRGTWSAALQAISVHLPAGAAEAIASLAGSAISELPPPDKVRPAGLGLTERALEESLQRGWSDTPFAELGVELCEPSRHGLNGRQVLTPVNAIDLLGYQDVEKFWWIIELKRGRTGDSVVGQISRYLGWIHEHHVKPGQNARGVVIAGEPDSKLVYAIRANSRLSLWLYDQDLRVRPYAG